MHVLESKPTSASTADVWSGDVTLVPIKSTYGVLLAAVERDPSRQRERSDRHLSAFLSISATFGHGKLLSVGDVPTDTFGSRYQNVWFLLEREQGARNQRRARLLRKRQRGTLTRAEEEELAQLQLEESERLAGQIQPAIDHLRTMLGR